MILAYRFCAPTPLYDRVSGRLLGAAYCTPRRSGFLAWRKLLKPTQSRTYGRSGALAVTSFPRARKVRAKVEGATKGAGVSGISRASGGPAANGRASLTIIDFYEIVLLILYP